MAILKKIFVTRPSRSRITKRTIGRVESLETRRLLATDVAVVGDSNADGAFNSSDFVEVFQAGKFETNQPATFAEGDWNGDGFFDSSDFVLAFQGGHYELPIALPADDGTGDRGADGGQPADETDEGGERDHGVGRHRALGRFVINRVIDKLTEGIESGELPGNLTAEEAQAIVDGLNAAIENGDREAIGGFLGQIREARRVDSIQNAINRLQAAVDEANQANEETLYGLPIAEVEAAIGAASESLANGDTAAANEALKPVAEAKRDAARAERIQNGIEASIARLQAAVDAANEAGDDMIRGVPVADVQATIISASEALAAGDTDAALAALKSLHQAQREARVAALLQKGIDRAQAAVDAAKEAGTETIGHLTVAEVEAIIASASDALEAGDIDAAKEALAGLRFRWHRGDRNDDRGGDEGDRNDDNEDRGERDPGEKDRGERDPGNNLRDRLRNFLDRFRGRREEPGEDGEDPDA